MPREFHATPGRRKRVPLMVGVAGPSSSGKTFSMLRLARGMQRVYKGKVFALETESGRITHYAHGDDCGPGCKRPDHFEFEHVPMDPPFPASYYLEGILWAVEQGAGVIIIDSASHMHEGEGGTLEQHEKMMVKLAKGDLSRTDAMKWAAWIPVKKEFNLFLDRVKRITVPMIFGFRARDQVKPGPGGKGEAMGWRAIGGEDLVYEMTAQALLVPGARGVPRWIGRGGKTEQLQTKLPGYFDPLTKWDGPLSEDMGEFMAKWAMGGDVVIPIGKREPVGPKPAIEALIATIAGIETLGELNTAAEENAGHDWTEGERAQIREALKKRKGEL